MDQRFGSLQARCFACRKRRTSNGNFRWFSTLPTSAVPGHGGAAQELEAQVLETEDTTWIRLVVFQSKRPLRGARRGQQERQLGEGWSWRSTRGSMELIQKTHRRVMTP